MLSVLSSYLAVPPVSLLLHPFLLLFLSLSLSALSGNLQHGHQYFCCSNGQQKKNKVERSRKTSLPHPEMLLLLSWLLPPFPSLLLGPTCLLLAPPLPLNCNLLPFGWLLLPRHWGSSCSTSAARINGRQLKQITFIVITPHVSPLPSLLLALIYLAFCLCDS